MRGHDRLEGDVSSDLPPITEHAPTSPNAPARKRSVRFSHQTDSEGGSRVIPTRPVKEHGATRPAKEQCPTRPAKEPCSVQAPHPGSVSGPARPKRPAPPATEEEAVEDGAIGGFGFNFAHLRAITEEMKVQRGLPSIRPPRPRPPKPQEPPELRGMSQGPLEQDTDSEGEPSPGHSRQSIDSEYVTQLIRSRSPPVPRRSLAHDPEATRLIELVTGQPLRSARPPPEAPDARRPRQRPRRPDPKVNYRMLLATQAEAHDLLNASHAEYRGLLRQLEDVGGDACPGPRRCNVPHCTPTSVSGRLGG